MNLNFIISNFFLNLGYFIITPRNYSFGAFYGTLLNGIKIANYLKKKKIICISLIDYHNKFGQKKVHNFNMTIKIIQKLKFDEIVFSILLSVFLLPFHIMYYLKITSVLNKVFFRNFSYKYIPKYYGYGEQYTNENLENKSNFVYQLRLEPKLYSQIDVNIFKNEKINEKKIAFCIKDENYKIIKGISEVYCSDINLMRPSLDYLINSGYEVNRIGEPLMSEFIYENKNYQDFTKSRNHLDKYNQTLTNSDFYIGSGASHGESVELFNKRKCIINLVDHSRNSFSYSEKNLILFKKIFDIKKKKILSIEELFQYELFDYYDVAKKYKNNEIILIENNEYEILDTVKNFLKTNEQSIEDFDYKLNKQYFEMRQLAVKKKLENKFCSLLLSCEFNKYSIPENFLNHFLFKNEYLDEISEKYYLENSKLFN